jgi:fatty-acyl-CoA synthase/long-chain acyl-CoA synthetase
MAAAEDWCEVSPLGDLLVRGARLHPERDALVLPGLRRTYAELLEGAVHVARGLLGLGIRRGDKVGLLAPNGIEYVEALFATQLIGAVVVPFNARHKATELGYIAENADLVAILTTSSDYFDFAEILQASLPSLARAENPRALQLEEAPRMRAAVMLAGKDQPGFLGRASFEEVAAEISPDEVEAARHRVRVRDVAAILYTSGTTANPKGCLLTHEAMTRGPAERARHRFGGEEADVTWGAGPLFHIGSLAPFIGSVAALGTYVTDVYFEPGRALDLMEQERVTVAWPWFPAILQPILDHDDFRPERLEALQTMLLIGPRSLLDRVQTLLPEAEAVQACGMTETAGIYALSDPSDPLDLRAEAQGRPSPGIEIRIVDPETGVDLAAGEVGEILVRGYCVLEGYYRDPAKSAEAIDDDGWFHTGDLYLQRPDGSLVFNGRLKDMLKVGGENVAALEVEAFLCEHPAIKLAEVVGRPDERFDEVPVAFVELRPGASAEAEEIIGWCKGKIANYKIPRDVIFMAAAEWPMSATKVNKRALRARLGTRSGA